MKRTDRHPVLCKTGTQLRLPTHHSTQKSHISTNGCCHEHSTSEEAGPWPSTARAILAIALAIFSQRLRNEQFIRGTSSPQGFASNATGTILSHPPHTLRGHLFLLQQRQHKYPAKQHRHARQLCQQRSPLHLFPQHFHHQPYIIRRTDAETKGHRMVRPSPTRRPQNLGRTEAGEDACNNGSRRVAAGSRKHENQREQLRNRRWHEKQDQTPRCSQGQRLQRRRTLRSRRAHAFERH